VRHHLSLTIYYPPPPASLRLCGIGHDRRLSDHLRFIQGEGDAEDNESFFGQDDVLGSESGGSQLGANRCQVEPAHLSGAAVCQGIHRESQRERVIQHAFVSEGASGRLAWADGLDFVVGHSNAPRVEQKRRRACSILRLNDCVSVGIERCSRNVCAVTAVGTQRGDQVAVVLLLYDRRNTVWRRGAGAVERREGCAVEVWGYGNQVRNSAPSGRPVLQRPLRVDVPLTPGNDRHVDVG